MNIRRWWCAVVCFVIGHGVWKHGGMLRYEDGVLVSDTRWGPVCEFCGVEYRGQRQRARCGEVKE